MRRRTGVGPLLLSELALLFGRRRTWALLAALAAIPILLSVAVRLSGGGGAGPVFVSAIAGNGLFAGFAAITVAVPLFLPLTVGVVSGDAIAGEARSARCATSW
ncbi:hypothetical protein ACH61_02397 [Rathayibacter tanaceti]|uniref:Uncharacterized protein n=1 Tax=Rathayibacter tanaceti TaxID=1671680 RepID=A0A166HEU4_9MICO|nr:hypothetical protein ACH61_02397 [Rathayibacter tanaceti]